MFELIGTRNEVYQEFMSERFLDHYSDEVIATFDLEEDALKYIEDSRLKKPYTQTFSSYVAFKKGSLLRRYESAKVEDHYPEEIPHNPVF